jgi:hypothetical protein
MSDEPISIGLELIQDLRRLMAEWQLDSIRAAIRAHGDHTIYVTLAAGAPITLEREDGHMIVLEIRP